MNFVLDNSVTMRWFFGDGKPQELVYARKGIDAMQDATAIVLATWGLDVANVIARAEVKLVVTEARSGQFMDVLNDLSIATDSDTFTHALGDTLQLARRYRLSAYGAS